MKKIYAVLAAAAAFASCEEFEPVFTFKYDNPQPYEYVDPADYTISTIASIVSPCPQDSFYVVPAGTFIKGRVSTTDQPGNFYKSLYIQDETGGIELKMGKNSLYNDYKEGQLLVVDCGGLYVGEYGYKSSKGRGMLQLGFDGSGTDYKTSYFESSLLVDRHVLRTDPSDIQKVVPHEMAATDFPNTQSTQATCKYNGQLVTIKNLTYGGSSDNAFVLMYLDSNKNKKESGNRIFLSGKSTGITTWAMSKQKMIEYLYSGIWDSVSIGNSGDYKYGKVGDKKDDGTYPAIEKNAYTTSQYFKTSSGKEIQVRTSGFCKFADVEIPANVLSKQKTVNVTGILSLYNGGIQITVNNIDDITFN